jgi:hypothetical protein
MVREGGELILGQRAVPFGQNQGFAVAAVHGGGGGLINQG